MEKVFGVVILYNPPGDVIQNIASYSTKLSRLLVFDNSESVQSLDLTKLGSNILYRADGVNRGIAERLNEAASQAIAEGAKWLLTMDQDSFFDVQSLEVYLSCTDSFKEKNRVAMFGLEYEQKQRALNCESKETTFLITSGSLVNLELFEKIGGFDEQLFIDEVDSEFCLRANMKAYKTIGFTNIFLNHSLGTLSQHRSLKSFRKTSRTLHSPLRVYYMVRNYLYIANKYQKHLPESFPFRKAAILNRIKNNFLYGPRKGQLLKYLVLAYRHYKSGNMGKLK